MNKTECIKILTLINDGNIDDLKLFVESNLTEIRRKEVYGNNYNKAVKRVIKDLKKASVRRPILGYYDIQNGEQIITDSFFLFKMKEGYFIDGIHYHENNHGNYPDVRHFAPTPDTKYECHIDIDKLINPDKTIEIMGKEVSLINLKNKNTSTSENSIYIENAIQILGTDNLNVYIYGTLRPVLLTSDRGEAVIMPVKIND